MSAPTTASSSPTNASWLQSLHRLATQTDEKISHLLFAKQYLNGASFSQNACTLVVRAVLHPVKASYTLVKLTAFLLFHFPEAKTALISNTKDILTPGGLAKTVMRSGLAFSIGGFTQLFAFSAPISMLTFTLAAVALAAAMIAYVVVDLVMDNNVRGQAIFWEIAEQLLASLAYAVLIVKVQKWLFQSGVEKGAAALKEQMGPLPPAHDAYMTRSGDAAFVYQDDSLKELVQQHPEFFEEAVSGHMHNVSESSFWKLGHYPSVLREGAAAWNLKAGTLDHIVPGSVTLLPDGTSLITGRDRLYSLMNPGEDLYWSWSDLSPQTSLAPQYTALGTVAPVVITEMARPEHKPPTTAHSSGEDIF